MDPRLIKYAEQPAPRYTSYPTAPHFTADVDGRVFAGWLADLDAEARLSLYLHIPYCREICRYCGCHTFATLRDEPIEDYAATLMREIDMLARTTRARVVTSIAWGGGTPNILAPKTFLALANALRARFDFSQMREHAIEIDPRLLTQAHVESFAQAGVTRASLGVQDLNDDVQEAIGRAQPAHLVEAAIARLRAAHINEINIDLMYGLPRQSVEGARASAEQAALWAPERIAVFGYAHVPWFKGRQRLIDEADLPGTELRFAQAEAVRGALEGAGYVAIGFDHYARPEDSLAAAARAGALTRSFQGYSAEDAQALIGLGASAISTLPQGYAQNAPAPVAWAKAIDAGAFATARGVAITDEDRRRRAVINRILCDFAIDLSDQGGLGAFGDAGARLAPLVADGLARIVGARIEVTDLGRPYARLIAEAFDAYRPQSAARHSRAV